MTIRPILTVPDPRLRMVCKPVDQFDKVVRMLVLDMFETMYDAKGRGLAAPQIGVLDRVFVMDCTWKEGEKTQQVFINPKVVSIGPDTKEYAEGCLSIPGQTFDVERPSSIKVSWSTLDGETQTKSFNGFEAICIQHEIDHLDGVLCLDYQASA